MFECREGVVFYFANEEARHSNKPSVTPISLVEYFKDLSTLMKTISHGPSKTFCFQRLRTLEAKFNLHLLLNETSEIACSKAIPHRDFYNVRKVDSHIHLSSAMNHKHLLKFIKRKLIECPNEKVIIRDGKELTLYEVFQSLHLTGYDLSVDSLDVHISLLLFRLTKTPFIDLINSI